MVTWVVVAPGFTALTVPAIWLRAESFTTQFLCGSGSLFATGAV